MNVMERILPVFHRNYPLERRDIVWDACMNEAMKIELNEGNLENMCGPFWLRNGYVEELYTRRQL